MPIFPTLTFEIHNLSGCRDEHFLFAALNFKLSNGQALQIKGENGSGKSTLLRILAGLLAPDEGEVLLNNAAILADRTVYYSNLSYLGHEPGIKLALTVKENSRLSTMANDEQIAAVLAELGLQKYSDSLCQQLSAGQKRRVALARILLQQRAIWLLDEPLTALDSKIRELWCRQMYQHLQRGGMIIFSTHQELTFETAAMQTIELS